MEETQEEPHLVVALEDLAVEQEVEHLSVVKVQVTHHLQVHLKVTLEEMNLVIKEELEVELQLQGKGDNLDLEELEVQVHQMQLQVLL